MPQADKFADHLVSPWKFITAYKFVVQDISALCNVESTVVKVRLCFKVLKAIRWRYVPQMREFYDGAEWDKFEVRDLRVHDGVVEQGCLVLSKFDAFEEGVDVDGGAPSSVFDVVAAIGA